MRRLFYWYVEAIDIDPATAPLVVWFNGGPGVRPRPPLPSVLVSHVARGARQCSSLGGGLFSEFGPFSPNADGALELNPYAWSRRANIVFIESPSGVGFSYSGDHDDYTVGDARTAADAYAFLLKFAERYPEVRAATVVLSSLP